MYKYSRVIAVEVRVDFINTGTSPVTLALAVLPYVDLSATTSPTDLIDIPRTVWTAVGGSTGMSKGTVSRLVHSMNELAQPVMEKAYFVTSGQAASGSPIDDTFPVIAASVGASTGSTDTWSGIATTRVRYHVEFFDLENPA